jgi:hypothetical protein
MRCWGRQLRPWISALCPAAFATAVISAGTAGAQGPNTLPGDAGCCGALVLLPDDPMKTPAPHLHDGRRLTLAGSLAFFIPDAGCEADAGREGLSRGPSAHAVRAHP